MSFKTNRKRLRSNDDSFAMQQSKYFVNEKLINLHDETKMKEIYAKTIDLLFKAAKSDDKNSQKTIKENCITELNLNGNGKLGYSNAENVEKPHWIGETYRLCKYCNKSSLLHVDCINCNLELCEFCGYSCYDCREPICYDCVSLFNCGTFDIPKCQRCKLYDFH